MTTPANFTPTLSSVRCYFGNTHSASQCCAATSTRIHIFEECTMLGVCCICKLMEFPSASNLVVKPKEEFVSLINVLDLIKSVANRGEYEAILLKDLSPKDKSFLELKGYQVSSGGKGLGPKVSWYKIEAPKRVSALDLDELIDLVDEAISSSTHEGKIFLPHPIYYDTYRNICQAFPGYYFQGKPSVMSQPYITWRHTVANSVPPSEFTNFRGYLATDLKKFPEKGSKKYGMTALIPDLWLQTLSSEFPHLLFSLTTENTGRKESQVLRWHPKPTKTFGLAEPVTPESDLVEQVISELGLYPPIGRLIINQGLGIAYGTEGLKSLLSFCDFLPKGVPQLLLTWCMEKLTPSGAKNVKYLFEGDFSKDSASESIRQRFVELLEKTK